MEIDPVFASTIVRRYTAYKQGTSDIRVIRYGKTLDCPEVYIPTEKDFQYQEGSVDEVQSSTFEDVEVLDSDE